MCVLLWGSVCSESRRGLSTDVTDELSRQAVLPQLHGLGDGHARHRDDARQLQRVANRVLRESPRRCCTETNARNSSG
jgi:hypothetical protein